MVVGWKDAARLVGISIIACCAVLVCAMFLNFYMDITGIKGEITSEQVMLFYEAQVSNAKVVSMVSGGCLLITSAVMLIFYVKHYIDTHKKELGILKALGYSNFKIAKNFWVFGSSVFLGAALGFGGAFLIMPFFYKVQNEDHILPEISVGLHPSLLIYLILLPTVAFAVLAICYAYYKLKGPVLALLKDSLPVPFEKARVRHRKTGVRYRENGKKHREGKGTECPFLEDLKKSTLRSKKVLVFFILFASFCFSATTQMSFSMKELSSVMMGAMIMLIGIVLACTTLFLGITTVVRGNTKTIAMMRVFGYSKRECGRALLSGNRPVAYVGFGIGTVYQYALLRVMVEIVFRDVEGVPVYKFDFPAMLVSLGAFLVIYEIVMYVYSEKIKKISVKEIMLE